MRSHFKILIAAAFLLASCGTSSVSPTATTEPLSSPSATPSPPPTEIPPQFTEEMDNLAGTTIEFWYTWTQLGDDPYQTAAAEFNQTNPYGITIQAVNKINLIEINQMVINNLGGANLPNITSATVSQYLTWERAADLVVDLSPYIGDAEVGIDTTKFSPVLWQQDAINGVHYGVPATRYANVLFFNQTWGNQLGFSQPPTTLDEFKQQACEGGWMIDQDPGTFLSWIYALGGEVIDENGYTLNTPVMRSLLEMIVELKDQDCAWRPLTPFENEDFAGREALFYSGSTRGIGAIEIAFTEASNFDRWTAIPFPGIDRSAAAVSGTSYVMLNATPEEQLASWLWMVYLSTPEVNQVLTSANGSLPLHTAALEDWQTEVLQVGRNEPQNRSWVQARPVLNDAVEQLFDFNFVPEDIEWILNEMQFLADEVKDSVGE